jgi:hypothetical protein
MTFSQSDLEQIAAGLESHSLPPTFGCYVRYIDHSSRSEVPEPSRYFVFHCAHFRCKVEDEALLLKLIRLFSTSIYPERNELVEQLAVLSPTYEFFRHTTKTTRSPPTRVNTSALLDSI